jgi:hypothetical protein
MHYEIPIAPFEEMVGQGLWVGHRFICNGLNLVLTAIGQAHTTDDGQRLVPVDIEYDPGFP